MASDKSHTASTGPKRLLTWRTATLAMPGTPAIRSPDSRAGLGVKQRNPIGAKAQPDHLTDLYGQARRQPRLDLPLLGVDRDDLGRTEIFRAEHATTHWCRIRKADVFGAHPQDKRPRSLCIQDFGHGKAGVR